MAYSNEQWERTKALFESAQYSLSEISEKRLFENGLSLRDIQSKTGISPAALSRKAKSLHWGKLIGKTTTKNGVSKSGHIYLITTEHDTPLYKIGVAIDVDSRIKLLQCGNPSLLILKGCYYTKNMYADESYWHSKFKDKQVLNEWFRLEHEDIEIFMENANRDLENHIHYLESLLSENKIQFKELQWLN